MKTTGINTAGMKQQAKVTKVFIGPPGELEAYSPSALMRYFIAAGSWSYGEFVVEVSRHHKTNVVSLDTIVNWANHDVEPTVYKAALLRMIEHTVAAERAEAWREAFWQVWAEHRARPKKRVDMARIRQALPPEKGDRAAQVVKGRTLRGPGWRLQPNRAQSRRSSARGHLRNRPSPTYRLGRSRACTPPCGDEEPQ